MTSMEESWRSWFCDLEAASDWSFILGADELGSVLQEEINYESCFGTDTFNNENGIEMDISNSNSNSAIIHNSIDLSHNTASQVDSNNLMLKGCFQGQREGKRSSSEGTSTSCPRPPDHIIAERSRREKITQHFIALSALIPGLKKVDKASVLEEAIRYVKELQEQEKVLEEQRKKKKGIESKVEATVSERNIRIQCEKQKGLVVNIITEIEKFRLSVRNSSVMPFGTSILDVTVITQMEEEFNLSMKELSTNLRVALSQLMECTGGF